MKKLKRRDLLVLPVCLFVSIVFGTGTVTAFAQDADSSVESESGESDLPQTVAVSGVTDDSQITQRLTRIFNSTDWFTNLNVESENGFITLTGTSDSDKHKQWAEKIATRTTDVVGVSNQLDVESAIDFGNSLSVVNDSLRKIWRELLAQLPLIIVGVLVLVLTWLVSFVAKKVISKILRRSENRIRRSLRDLLLQLVSIAIWVTGLMVATVVVFPGMTPAKALTVLGLGSIAIGFAFKDIFENFFAGILILWRYPFEIGDFIEFNGIVGKVEETTIRNTMLRRTDGELVIVPNAEIFKSNVEVLTSRKERRIRIICGVAYGEDANEAQDVIHKAVSGCESVFKNREVQVFAKEFADSSINFELAWWTAPTPLEVRKSRDEVVRAVKAALDNADIEIPFPYRTLTFKHPLHVAGDDSQLLPEG